MSHMWSPYVPPKTMPTHPPVDAFHVNPDGRDYFSQYGGVPQIGSSKYTGFYGWPTAPAGTNHAWHLHMPSSGWLTPGSGELRRDYRSKRPALIDSRHAFHSVDGRHEYGFVSGSHADNNRYTSDGRGLEHYTNERFSLSGQGHSSSHGQSFEQLPGVSRWKRKTQGKTEDLDKQRNRESSFHHPPIDFGRRQIRLVRVLPSGPGDPIRCKFALSMVDNESVRYTALSYTWGSASSVTDIQKIRLHKQDFWVRHNLWGFLRQVRDDPVLRANWYWIDALCIDQAENGRDGQQEKNHQVNMMSQIYSNAYMAMTWLGEPEPEERAALEALQDCLDGTSSKQQHDLIRQGFRYLGDSPYWSRIWIIQEMVLAKRARFRVGDYDYDWDSVYKMRLDSRKSNTRYLQDMGWAMTNILDLRQDWYKGRPLDLLSAIHDFGTHKCSDPRDKIYGLLGLMRYKPCIPDYSKSCKDLYMEVLLWALSNGVVQVQEYMNGWFWGPRPLATVLSTILELNTFDLREQHDQLIHEAKTNNHFEISTNPVLCLDGDAQLREHYLRLFLTQ